MNKILSLVFIALLTSISVSGQSNPPTETAMSRFLRYIKIDTQAAEEAGKVPSTDKQLVLARLL